MTTHVPTTVSPCLLSAPTFQSFLPRRSLYTKCIIHERLYNATGVEALFLTAFFYAGTNALVRHMSPMRGDQAQVLLALLWPEIPNKWEFASGVLITAAALIGAAGQRASHKAVPTSF